MTTPTDPPNPCLPYSHPKPMTTDGSSLCPPHNIRPHYVIHYNSISLLTLGLTTNILTMYQW
ncbi:hypothetical protein PCK2_000939 [Pneumocystis canis]|nr:hypothetical protein PCK2_000939 [Pneumocystis canis]